MRLRPSMAASGRTPASVASWSGMLLLVFSLALLLAPTVRAADEPTLKSTKFDGRPGTFNYFEDSDVVMFQDLNHGTIWRSTDAGVSWERASTIEHDAAAVLIMHEFDKSRAFVLTKGNVHWRTKDKGETWEEFRTLAYTSAARTMKWMSFHAQDPDRIIFYGMECEGIICSEVVMYTTDGFATKAKYLRDSAVGCWWAKSAGLFTTGQDDLDAQRILCIVHDRGMWASRDDNRLLVSDNYFDPSPDDPSGQIQEFEPNLNGGDPVRGIANIAVVKQHILVAASSRNTDEMALYVTGDTLKWHRAVFPQDHRIDQEAYTVLEGTNYSIQIDVMTSPRLSQPMGVLFTSNSNGTYFTRNVEHTNRNEFGNVDFEKVSGIQGIFLVNQVENWEAVENGNSQKESKTKITFDDGRTFEAIKNGHGEIHLHSVTEINNVGSIFSSPAPGLVMGNGNVGPHLEEYWKSSLYVSDDAGRNWIQGPGGPHKYEFGDQGSILVAISDSEKDDVDEIKYSLNHGLDWKTTKLPDGLKVHPWILTTTQDSTSLKFLLAAYKGSSRDPTDFFVISVDFEGMHEDTCKDSDMEDWFARVDDDGKPSCVMGHTQKYRRRKKDAKCFVKDAFHEALPEFEPCECTDADFECDFNFVRDGDECKPAGVIPDPDGACAGSDPATTFTGSSGWRLIPGNQCKRSSGTQKDDKKEWKCSDSDKAPVVPGTGEPSHLQTPFKGDFNRFEKHYLERGESSTQDDETIIARPYSTATRHGGDIWITHDHGKNWTTPKYLQGEKIWAIATHPYYKDMAFFLTTTEKVFYTVDRGRNFDSFKTRDPPDLSPMGKFPLAFHPDRKDWLIWHGQKCKEGSSSNCYLEASLSTDRGDSWKTIVRYVEKCEFTGSAAFKDVRNETQVICLAKQREDNEPDNRLQLKYSDDLSKYDLSVAVDDVKDFATMAEFIVVATENQTESTLAALASLNGRDYAPAHFPPNFQVSHQSAYTVLDSSTHAVNLFVVTEDTENRRMGSILKSNSNGTSYVLSASAVNCDNSYFVDFEKMLGLEGVELVNTVETLEREGTPKKLQTKISHNDGSQWSYLPPPEKDVDGKAYECYRKVGDETCALHIHGYTEREDHRKTYSSEKAVGLMFGIGNVGPYLGRMDEADTFMTSDAGVTWKNVKKGRWVWSFGDQGSIVVLAQTNTRIKSVSYSLDQGETWSDYNFADSEVTITDITTLRSGASRNFLLWGHKGDQLFTVNLDFSGLADKACHHDEEDESASDYYLWSPEHPLQPNGCLFGHKNQYLRKKADRKCYNGKTLEHLYGVEDCECTRQDFECDYNFELDNHGQCGLVENLQPLSGEQYCSEHPDEMEFYDPSGFRRIPLTTCKGGKELDKVREAHPCPGREEDFSKAHATSGAAIFFAIVLPIGFAATAGWWVWRNWRGNFGQIRLGEQHSLDSNAPWVKYPVIAVSAVVAVVGALPLLAGSLWRSARSTMDNMRGSGGSRGDYSWLRGGGQRRFTTRDSFARGREDYGVMDEDEGELLGDESDDEV